MYICIVISNKTFERISKALGDPNRVAILQEIKRNKNCLFCSEIHELVNLAQPSISHHLKQLADAELIIPEKEGRNLKYALNKPVIDDYIDFLRRLNS